MKSLYIILTFLIAKNIYAADLGIGIAGFSLPHYFGSQEHYQLAIPLLLPLPDFSKDSTYVDVKVDFRLPISGKRSSASEPKDYDNDSKILTSYESYTRRGMGFIPLSLFVGAKAGVSIDDLSFEVGVAPGIQ